MWQDNARRAEILMRQVHESEGECIRQASRVNTQLLIYNSYTV